MTSSPTPSSTDSRPSSPLPTVGLVRRGYSSTGGAERYLLRLADQLLRNGHDLLLFTDVAWPEDALSFGPIRQILVPAGTPISFARQLQIRLPQHTCDVLLSLERVFTCDIYRAGDGVHAAWLDRRAPFQPAWKRMFRWVNGKHRQLLTLERALFTGGARRVIANSTMVKREIVGRYRYPAAQVDVVYNGVPAANLDPGARDEVRSELGLGPEEYVALFVGSGWERKGLRFACQAASEVQGLHLLVAGNDRGTLPFPLSNAEAASSHRRIPPRFLGPRSDVPRLMAAADVFILPTIYDPFSNACLEALASGLPVITTRANGFAEIMTPGVHGSIVDDPSDCTALASALRDWQDVSRRESTRAARIARAAEFSMERNLAETVQVILRLKASA